MFAESHQMILPTQCKAASKVIYHWVSDELILMYTYIPPDRASPSARGSSASPMKLHCWLWCQFHHRVTGLNLACRLRTCQIITGANRHNLQWWQVSDFSAGKAEWENFTLLDTSLSSVATKVREYTMSLGSGWLPEMKWLPLLVDPPFTHSSIGSGGYEKGQGGYLWYGR